MHTPIGGFWSPQAEAEEKEANSEKGKSPTHYIKVNIYGGIIKKQKTISFKKDEDTNDKKTNISNNAQNPFECTQMTLLLPQTIESSSHR
jgi:hypothetical protein